MMATTFTVNTGLATGPIPVNAPNEQPLTVSDLPMLPQPVALEQDETES